MNAPRPSHLRDSQNFLQNPRLVRRLLDQSSLDTGDLVIEIGPGGGIITVELAARCRQVLAIEPDPRLVGLLRRRLRGCPNVALFEADFVGFPLPRSPYKVFANIPFNQTTAIISHLTEVATAPHDVFLVVQREAAARFTGMPRETLMSLLLKPWFAPSVVHHFARADFAPRPGVDCVLLRLEKRGPPLIPSAQRQAYRDLVCALFSAWQPTVAAGLARLAGPRPSTWVGRQTGLDVHRPPTALSFSEWLTLATAVLRPEAPPRLTVTIAGAEARLRQQQAGLTKLHRTRSRRP